MTGTIKKRVMSLLMALAVLVSAGLTLASVSLKANAACGCTTLKSRRISTAEIEKAINWACKLADAGARGWNSKTIGEWTDSWGWCTRFVSDAFYDGANLPRQRVNSAPHFLDVEGRGNEHRIYQGNPPRGAIALYTGGSDGSGHVAISLGDGRVVEGGNGKVQYNNLSLTMYLPKSSFTYKGYMWYGDMLPPISEPKVPLKVPKQTYDHKNKTYLVGENIQISWTESTGNCDLDHYWVGIFDKNNNRVFQSSPWKTPRTTARLDAPGTYKVEVWAEDVNHNTQHTVETITVTEGSAPKITAPKNQAEVETRLANIKGGQYGVNKTFPYSSTPVPASLAGEAGGTRTDGYARYVFYNTFGIPMSPGVSANQYQLTNSNGNLAVVASCSGTSTAQSMKADVFKAKPGDIIQGKGNGFYQTMVVLSYNDSGITVLDCDNDYKCGILERTRDWSRFSGSFKQYTIYRSKNYPVKAEINDPPAAISGDVNGDGKANVIDAVLLIDYLLNEEGKNPDLEREYDYNGDGQFNILDVTKLISDFLDNLA